MHLVALPWRPVEVAIAPRRELLRSRVLFWITRRKGRGGDTRTHRSGRGSKGEGAHTLKATGLSPWLMRESVVGICFLSSTATGKANSGHT